MADSTKAQTFAEKRLSITRETELLQSYVRIIEDDEDLKEDDSSTDNKQITKNEQTLQQQNQQKRASLETEIGKSKLPQQPPEVTEKLLSKKGKEDSKGKKGKRRKKKNNRHEEVYCDKDRAAAAAMGSKDIKQALKSKRKQDRSKALQIPEEAEPGTFLALGNYEMCRGDLQIALDFISKALELNPTEKCALVARSKCYILLGQPENALKDAETALQIDKGFMKAIYQKAESLYYLGDFEHSLMYYHRGLHIRPDHEGFKLGVHKAQKAIENALGAGFPDITKLSSSRRSTATPKRSNLTSSMLQSDDDVSDKYSVNNTTTNKTSQRTTPTSRAKSGTRKSRLLRELGADKDYLDNLVNNPNIKCKYKEDDSSIENCIKETVEYLNARQEFWRQQLPPNLK